MSPSNSETGQPADRVDGPLKVTGQARYAGEFRPPDRLHGRVVNSTIPRGRIRRLHTADAEAAPGVALVLTHENRPPVADTDEGWKDSVARAGSPFRPLFDECIRFSGQPVALVVAESLEQARYAASLVHVEYEAEPHATDLAAGLDRAEPAPGKLRGQRGDVDAALQRAAYTLEREYSSPIEHHNPMEPHAATVEYRTDGSLEVYDKTQGVLNSLGFLERVFDMEGRIRLRSPYVGGAFGAGLRPQYQLTLAVMAALKLRRSVQVVLTRQQMFTLGYRPPTVQRLQLGAASDGTLEALRHQAIGQTSTFEQYTETVVDWSSKLYQCPNVALDYRLVSRDVFTPLDMRAPGASLGVYALECTMDELAEAMDMDPLALRLKNYAKQDQVRDKPFSSKALRECYEQGAERFGWSRRPRRPRSMREGHQLVGWGMATGIWGAMQAPASARARLEQDGRLVVSSATTDIGTGTYTIMSQIAAEALGLPLERVEFQLGDSSLPAAPLQGGSATAASVGSAVLEACGALREQLLERVRQWPEAEFADADPEAVTFADGSLHHPNGAIVELERIAAQAGPLEAEVRATPSDNRRDYSPHTHAAVFAEVKVDEDLGTVRVSRVVSAVAAGRILNPKTAASQISGGVVWGIGMALQEETRTDHTLGRHMNHNLAEYHIPVNADIGDIDVIFVDEEDRVVNELGVKGVGEIGVVGVAAAISNAVYHATGKWVRELPITLDKLL